MPIYEYNCTKCHKHFEVMQKMSEPCEASCPDCGNPAKRIISRSSFALKGGGWYKDGYGSKGSAGSAGSESSKTEAKKPEVKAPETKKQN